MSNELRWKQRFQNFENAYAVFERRITEYRQYPNQEVYQMALVQAFEMAIELSWKTLRDYLQNQGYFDIKNGKQAIRQAFQDGMVSDSENWMEAIDLRNATSHLYDPAVFNKIIVFLDRCFVTLLRDLHIQLKKNL